MSDLATLDYATVTSILNTPVHSKPFGFQKIARSSGWPTTKSAYSSCDQLVAPKDAVRMAMADSKQSRGCVSFL
jgi:hypothetical protein